MKVLIAEDDDVSRFKLEELLAGWGYQVISTADGLQAWQALAADDPPRLAILDWIMPGLEGVEVCRRARATPRLAGLYVLLLTARESQACLSEGLRAGANDYVTKPFHPEELHARIALATQLVLSRAELAARVKELEEALAQVKRLRGLLPICSYCKSVRDDQNYWHELDRYVSEHSGAQLSHSVCPACWKNIVKPQYARHGIHLPDEPPGPPPTHEPI